MGRKWLIAALLALFVLEIVVFITGQTLRRQVRPRAIAESNLPCQFGGTYRINVDASDRLYSAVRDATSSVPFRDQQEFFMDLSVRLTPPDLLAISCSSNQVSVASSRASKVTFTADGRSRRERSSTGTYVNSRISMTSDTVTFTSNGKADDNLNVVFRSIDSGSRLRVTRRIDAEQLSQPLIIQSVYDRISDAVDWNIYQDRMLADKNAGQNVLPPTKGRKASPSQAGSGETATDLRSSLDEWIARRTLEILTGKCRSICLSSRPFT